jgi:hypothetical protein
MHFDIYYDCVFHIVSQHTDDAKVGQPFVISPLFGLVVPHGSIVQ